VSSCSLVAATIRLLVERERNKTQAVGLVTSLNEWCAGGEHTGRLLYPIYIQISVFVQD